MKTPIEQLGYLQWSAIDKITKIVELAGVTFEEQHRTLQLIRNHLESRAQQTATPFIPPSSNVLEDAPPRPAEITVAISAPDAELNALLGL